MVKAFILCLSQDIHIAKSKTGEKMGTKKVKDNELLKRTIDIQFHSSYIDTLSRHILDVNFTYHYDIVINFINK